MHKDGLMARGTVNLVLRNEQGKVKQHKTVRNKITEAIVRGIAQHDAAICQSHH